MASHGYPPTTPVFNSVISACGRSGKWEELPRLCQEMAGGGCQPTVVTYACMVKGYGDAGKVEMAKKSFDEMVTRGIK